MLILSTKKISALRFVRGAVFCRNNEITLDRNNYLSFTAVKGYF